MQDTHRLDGRVALVTGATSGHGRAVARALAGRGADLVLLGRDPRRLAATRQWIERQTGHRAACLVCDLSSRQDIDRAADAFAGRGGRLDILVNNAGVVHRTRVENREGIEMTFAVNYLAQFQLSLRLLDKLLGSRPARIVNVASDAHKVMRLRLDDLELRRGYSWWAAYGHSKLALVYFTRELARRLRGTGVTANAVDPGPVASRIASNNPGLVAKGVSLAIRALFPSPRRAARTAVYLASSPDLEGVSGCYFKWCRLRAPRVAPDELAVARRLWAESSRLTGVDYPGYTPPATSLQPVSRAGLTSRGGRARLDPCDARIRIRSPGG